MTQLADQVREALAACGRGRPPAPRAATASAVEVRAPVRLDLGMAGPADCPPFCLRASASSINASIVVQDAPVEVVVRPGPGTKSRWSIGSTAVSTGSVQGLAGSPLWPAAVVTSTVALELLGLQSADELVALLGGGPAVSLHSGLPAGTGLGTSSVLWASLALALTRSVGVEPSYAQVALTVMLAELRQGGIGGWEDVTALLGGWKLAETNPSSPFIPTCSPLTFEPAVERELGASLRLLWTGPRSDDARAAFDAVPLRLGSRDAAAVAAVSGLHQLNRYLLDGLQAGRCDAVPVVLRHQWQAWQEMTSAAGTTVLGFVERVESLGGAARYAGAGGGGCMVVWAPPRIARAVDGAAARFSTARWLHWMPMDGVVPDDDS